MTTEGKSAAGYVKKETMLLVTCVALLVGFLAGVVFSAYKSGPAVQTVQVPAPSGQASPQQNFSPEDSSRILALERELAGNPSSAGTWAQLGNLYFDSGKFVKAINAYNKSLALAPNNASVLTDLGVMYRRNGQPQEAIAAFDRAMAVDPRHEQSRFNKGIVLRYDLNDRDGAVRAWEELLQIKPDAMAPNGIPIKDAIKDL